MGKTGQQPVIERFDPRDIFNRDQRIRQICRTAVDPTVRWPHTRTATLGHH